MAINKYSASIKDENNKYSSEYLYNVPSNAKIKINYPTVSMPSDWEIGRIAVTNHRGLMANEVDYQVFYGPLYD